MVIPARRPPARPEAFAYTTGGPGGVATDETYSIGSRFAAVNRDHDILSVDQRGTGGSHALSCTTPLRRPRTAAGVRRYVGTCLRTLRGELSQYGTRQAMDDLDAVRARLRYPRLDVYAVSHGGTAAQVLVRRHPRSVRTLVLDGVTAIDLPFLGRIQAASQHALDQVAARCAADAACQRAFPRWRRQFSALVRAWDANSIRDRRHGTTTGGDLAGVVRGLLFDTESARSIPLLVSRAAHGDLRPFYQQLHATGGANLQSPPYWLIWCNEPWVGLSACGPWHTDFDSNAAAGLGYYHTVCAAVPRHAEPTTVWRFPHGPMPVLVLAGGQDPQDPLANLPRLKSSFPNSRAIVVRDYGHWVSQYGCLPRLISDFVSRGGSHRLETSCTRRLRPPRFTLR